MQDMQRYTWTLFGTNVTIEDLLEKTPWQNIPECSLIRVKHACKKKDGAIWPELIEQVMRDTVAIHTYPEIIKAKAKKGERPKERLYDTLQVTPNQCSCRVTFGADAHYKACWTSAWSTTTTQSMDKMLMKKFFHSVVNRYDRNNGINAHQDISETYHSGNAIASLSYNHGSIVTKMEMLHAKLWC